MASLLVMRTRRLAPIKHGLLSLPSFRPQIQGTHNLLRIILLIDLRFYIFLTALALLRVENGAVPAVGSQKKLRTELTGVPGTGAVVASEVGDNLAGPISFRKCTAEVFGVLVVGSRFLDDCGMQVKSVVFHAWCGSSNRSVSAVAIAGHT